MSRVAPSDHRPVPDGTRIHVVHDMAGLERVADVFAQVWGLSSTSSVASPDMLRAISHAGGYVAAAVDPTGRTVAASMGFRGVHADRPSLHSHVTGVLPSHAHRGLGRELKQHQRAWARSAGIDCITWTFDPLVRRNAWFNLQVLGVEVEQYLVDFYGPLGDDINGDDETDRLLAVWWIGSDRAVAAATGNLPAPTARPGVGIVHLVAVGDDGSPVVARDVDPSQTDALTAAVPDALTITVPDDIVSIRRHSPELADRWRKAVRSALGGAMDDDWVVDGMSDDGRYVLRRRVTT